MDKYLSGLVEIYWFQSGNSEYGKRHRERQCTDMMIEIQNNGAGEKSES